MPYSILEDTMYNTKLATVRNETIIPNSEISIAIKFESENFFHLFGFHYLENLDGPVNNPATGIMKGLRGLQ